MKKTKNICCSSDQVKEKAKKHYGKLVKREKSSCCSPFTIEEGMRGRLAQLAGYGEEERSKVPEEAYLSSFGCGKQVCLLL